MKKSKLLSTIMAGIMVTLSLSGCGSAKNSSEASAKNYPDKTLQIIVAYKAGGGTDVGARILASAAQKEFGKSIIIVNKPGSDGELGFTETCKAKPDGYTIGFINLPTFVALPQQRKTSYSSSDVVPIMNFVFDSTVLVVRANDNRFKTLEDFTKYAKAHPSEINVSNNGTGASDHLAAANLCNKAGIKVTHVPFGGSADMLAALRGKKVDATVAKISETATLVKSGELRILASFTQDRLADFPNVPTLTEKGYPIVDGSARALVAPKGTPKEIVTKLHDVFKAAMETQDLKDKAAKINLPLKYMGPEDLQKYMDTSAKDTKETLKLISQ